MAKRLSKIAIGCEIVEVIGMLRHLASPVVSSVNAALAVMSPVRLDTQHTTELIQMTTLQTLTAAPACLAAPRPEAAPLAHHAPIRRSQVRLGLLIAASSLFLLVLCSLLMLELADRHRKCYEVPGILVWSCWTLEGLRYVPALMVAVASLALAARFSQPPEPDSVQGFLGLPTALFIGSVVVGSLAAML